MSKVKGALTGRVAIGIVALLVGVSIGLSGASEEELNQTREELAAAQGELERKDAANTDLATQIDERDARIKELTAEGEVPDLSGKRLDDAHSLAEDFKWNVKSRKAASGAEPGTIINQTPKPGSELKRFGTLNVTVATPRPKKWTTISSFSGSGERKSDEFTIPDGPKTRIKYSFTGDTNAQLDINPVGGEEFEGENLLNEIGDYSQSTRFFESGQFYFEACCGTWSIEVQQFK